MGGYRKGVNIKQFDYLLLCPELFLNIKESGLHRKGVSSMKRPVWSIFSNITKKEHEASAHPVIWVDLNI